MKTTPLLLTALLLGCTPADPPAAAPPGAEYACVGEGTMKQNDVVVQWIGEAVDAQGRLVEEVFWHDAERTQLGTRMTWRYEGELLAEHRVTYGSMVTEPTVLVIQYHYNDQDQLIRSEGWREGSDTLEGVDTFIYDEDGNEIEWRHYDVFYGQPYREVKVWEDGRLQQTDVFLNDEPTPSARLVRTYAEPPPGLDYLETTEDLIDGVGTWWEEVTHDPAGRIQRETTGLPGADATSWRDFAWDEAGRPLEEDYLSEILDTSQTQRWRYDERGLLVERRTIIDSIKPSPQRTEYIEHLDWDCR